MTDAQARDALDLIHARMCFPWEWSSDTPEAVWEVLERAGYGMPEEHEVDALAERFDYEIPIDEFAQWRP